MATSAAHEATWQGDLMCGARRRSTRRRAARSGRCRSRGPSRAEDARRQTSPEELIAAAHAACFSMALSHGLAQAGTRRSELETSATRHVRPRHGITKRADRRRATSRASTRRFREAAEDAKGTARSRGALKGNVELDARRRACKPKAWPRHVGIEQLVDELERNYRETQERHVRPCRLQRPPRGGRGRPAAEGARGAVQARPGVALRRSDDLDAARDDAELARAGPRARGASSRGSRRS